MSQLPNQHKKIIKKKKKNKKQNNKPLYDNNILLIEMTKKDNFNSPLNSLNISPINAASNAVFL